MNILVAPYSGNLFYFRSDTTLIRAIDKYFVPECVSAVSIIPIVYFRCSRPGKAVAVRFAHRFIDAFGYGILIRPELAETITDNRPFIANALDYTSHIPLDIFPLEQYADHAASHPFRIAINGIQVFKEVVHPELADIHTLISRITPLCSTRVGDFIACELAFPLSVDKGEYITGEISGKRVIGFQVL